MRCHATTALLFLLPLLGTSCATDRQFAPRENGNGFGPTGRPSAVYALAPPGHGEVRVWSDGAERVGEGTATATMLYLGFELENTGTEAISLDPTDLQVADVVGEDGAALPVPTLQSGATTTAAPATTARGDFMFQVPGEVMPRSIMSFHVRWRVQAGTDGFAQSTPFQTFYPNSIDRFYDPWPWWGFGVGSCWGGGGHCHH
jgi:hypothetical protein